MGRQSSVSTKGSTATSAGGCSSSSWKADSYDVAQGSILSVSTCAGTPLLLQSAERHFRRYVLKVNGLEEAVNKVMALCQPTRPVIPSAVTFANGATQLREGIWWWGERTNAGSRSSTVLSPATGRGLSTDRHGLT